MTCAPEGQSPTDRPTVSFAEADDRREAMYRAIGDWLTDLSDLVEAARASETFRGSPVDRVPTSTTKSVSTVSMRPSIPTASVVYRP
jgi:hypothetical protein